MTVRSVIEIDIQDERFREFAALFGKYQEALKTLPGAWGKTEEVIESTGGHFAAITAALMAQAELHRKIDDTQRREEAATKRTADGEAAAAKKKLDDQKKHDLEIERSRRIYKDIAKSTYDAGKNIAVATVSLLKWVGITGALSGLVGAGGLFGFDRLISGVTQARRAAEGIGVTTGENKAFEINYKQVVDPQSFLSNIQDIAVTPAKQRGIGVEIGQLYRQGYDVAQIGVQIIPELKRLAEQFGATQPGYINSGADLAVSLQDFLRISRLSDKELGEHRGGYLESVKKLSVDDPTNKRYQDALRNLDEAGAEIKKVFVVGLAPIGPQIKQLSEAVVGVTAKWVKDLGPDIDKFAAFLGSDKFKQDVKDFADAVDTLAHSALDLAHWITSPDNLIRKYPKEAGATAAAAAVGGVTAGVPGAIVFGGAVGAGSAGLEIATNRNEEDRAILHKWFPYLFGPYKPAGGNEPSETGTAAGRARIGYGATPINNPGNLRPPGASTGFDQFATPEAGIVELTRQLRLYIDKYKVDTIEGIVSRYEGGPANPDHNDIEGYIRGVVKSTGLERWQHISSSDDQAIAKIVSAITRQENKNSRYTPTTVIEIMNNTGGSAVIATSQVNR